MDADASAAAGAESAVKPAKPGGLEEQLRNAIRSKHYSRHTGDAYAMWYRQFVLFHGKKHPAAMGEAEITAFLQHICVKRNVAASTHNQALNALVFFYRVVLKQELVGIEKGRSHREKRLPVVLTVAECKAVLTAMAGAEGIMARLLYGCGLRVAECLNLRIKDVDLAAGVLTVRGGKGDKDRVVELPQRLLPALGDQVDFSKRLWEADRREERPGVYLPYAFAVKQPKAGTQWPWFWLFPAAEESVDPDSGAVRRHHLHESRISRALTVAAKVADMSKRVTAHTLRHSYATHLLMKGVDIRSIQERMGHSSVATTEIYRHVVKAMQGAVRSPLDDW